MYIIFSKNSTVAFIMKKYLQETKEDFGDNGVSVTMSPAQKGMLVVDKRSERSGKVKSERLHSITEKLLHLSNRARPDINLAIDFLRTRVSKITVQD